MASPHVAGVAALIEALGVKNPAVVTKILTRSAVEVPGDTLNYYGAGRLDAAKAVYLARFGGLPDFGFDFGAIALLPKLVMLAFATILSWLLRRFLRSWNLLFPLGLVMGSSGLFFLQGLQVANVPGWLFRLLGSSIPELGTAIQGGSALNPIFASVLIPIGLFSLLLGNRHGKWFAVGTTVGMASCLAVSAAISPHLVWIGEDTIARGFLLVNAILCFYLARLTLKEN